MDKKQIHRLCTSGAFNAFIELMDTIEEPKIVIGERLEWMVGKRDGFRELKSTLKETIEKIAKQ